MSAPVGLQEMLGESLLDKKLLQEKEHLGHRAIKLLQRRARMLSSTANTGFRKLQDERTELERQLQGELATRHCQVLKLLFSGSCASQLK